MHLHADHALFFERRQPLWVAALAIALTSSVLIVNAGTRSITLSLVGSGLGAGLLLLARARGRRRIEPALAWALALVALALLGGVVLESNADAIVQTSLRVLCGVIWVLWLGTQVDWASLRQLLLWLRIPEDVVASLDHALMHGVLTQREWVQRRDAARLRLGSPRLPLAAWGPLLGEGALHAFARLEHAEENAVPPATTLRLPTASASMPSTSNGVDSWCSSSSSFAWQERSGCSCAGRAGPASRACCACSRGSTDPRKAR